MNLPKGIRTERVSIYGKSMSFVPKKKVTDEQVREIRASKESNVRLAEIYGIDPKTASAIRKLKSRRLVK